MSLAFILVVVLTALNPAVRAMTKPVLRKPVARIVDPSFSFDGRYLGMVVDEPRHRPRLRVVDLETGKLVRLPKLPGRIDLGSGPSWSPKDDALTIGCRQRDGTTEVWYGDVGTRKVRRLVSFSDWLQEPGRWSPDGSRLLLDCTYGVPAALGTDEWAPGGWRSRLRICSLDGATEEIDSLAYVQDRGFEWSGDGRALWISGRFSGGRVGTVENGVLFLPLETRKAEKLSDLRHVVRLVRSPDGKLLACGLATRSIVGRPPDKLVVLNTADRTVRTVGEGRALHRDCWSRDGRRIVYAGLPPPAVRTLSEDGRKLLVSAPPYGSVELFDIEEEEHEHLPRPIGRTDTAFWRPGTDRVCCLEEGRRVLEYDGSAWTELFVLPEAPVEPERDDARPVTPTSAPAE